MKRSSTCLEEHTRADKLSYKAMLRYCINCSNRCKTSKTCLCINGKYSFVTEDYITAWKLLILLSSVAVDGGDGNGCATRSRLKIIVRKHGETFL